MADSERSASGVLVLLLWAAELPSRLLTGSIFPMPFVRADRFCLFPACCTPVRSVGLNLIFSRAIALIDVNVFSLPPLYLKKHLIWELNSWRQILALMCPINCAMGTSGLCGACCPDSWSRSPTLAARSHGDCLASGLQLRTQGQLFRPGVCAVAQGPTLGLKFSYCCLEFLNLNEFFF